jgi:hypothetical protein
LEVFADVTAIVVDEELDSREGDGSKLLINVAKNYQ